MSLDGLNTLKSSLPQEESQCVETKKLFFVLNSQNRIFIAFDEPVSKNWECPAICTEIQTQNN